MRALRATALAAAIALSVAGVAQGVKTKQGNVIVAFNGGISPHALPRTVAAPVAVRIASDFSTSDGTDPPPQLQEIAIGINREGTIFDRGLPICRIRRIQPSTIAAAKRICGGAIVGSGYVRLRISLGGDAPFTFTGPLLVFHTRRFGGHRRLLAQVYGTTPPSAFVLTFTIVRTSGSFGTLIRTTLPQETRKWAYVTHFDMTLRRTYVYHGKRHSYVSASCPAPAGLPGAVYPFARGKFAFAGGLEVTTTLTRDCRVR